MKRPIPGWRAAPRPSQGGTRAGSDAAPRARGGSCAAPSSPPPLPRRRVLRMPHRQRPLLAIWHPDVLHLGRLLQKLLPLAAARVGPVACVAVLDPSPFHVARRQALDLGATPVLSGPEVPDPVHVVVRGEHRSELTLNPG